MVVIGRKPLLVASIHRTLARLDRTRNKPTHTAAPAVAGQSTGSPAPSAASTTVTRPVLRMFVYRRDSTVTVVPVAGLGASGTQG